MPKKRKIQEVTSKAESSLDPATSTKTKPNPASSSVSTSSASTKSTKTKPKTAPKTKSTTVNARAVRSAIEDVVYRWQNGTIKHAPDHGFHTSLTSLPSNTSATKLSKFVKPFLIDYGVMRTLPKEIQPAFFEMLSENWSLIQYPITSENLSYIKSRKIAQHDDPNLQLYWFLFMKIHHVTKKNLGALTTKLLNILGHNVPIYDTPSKKALPSKDYAEFYAKFKTIVEEKKSSFENYWDEEKYDEYPQISYHLEGGGLRRDWTVERAVMVYLERGGKARDI